MSKHGKWTNQIKGPGVMMKINTDFYPYSKNIRKPERSSVVNSTTKAWWAPCCLLRINGLTRRLLTSSLSSYFLNYTCYHNYAQYNNNYLHVLLLLFTMAGNVGNMWSRHIESWKPAWTRKLETSFCGGQKSGENGRFQRGPDSGQASDADKL